MVRVGGRLVRHRFIRREKYIKVRSTYLSLERSNVRHVPYLTSALTVLNHAGRLIAVEARTALALSIKRFPVASQ